TTGTDSAPNTGASDSPFRSLKQSIAVADVGDTIQLMDGKYSALPVASGGSAETWGYTLPTNVTITGQTTAGTILDGVGVNSVDGFDVAQTLAISNMTIQDFRYGIDVAAANSTFTMTNTVLGNNSQQGVRVEQAATGSTVNILGATSLINQPGLVALYVYNVPNVTVNIMDATLQGGSDVIQYYYNVSGSKLNINHATIKQLSTANAINIAASSNATGTAVTLTNATIAGSITDSDTKGSLTITGGTVMSPNDAIDFSGNALTMTTTALTVNSTNNYNDLYITSGIGSMISLSGVTISGGGRGIFQNGAGSAVKLRMTTVQNTTYDAYYLVNGDLDLGTAADNGNGNFLATPATAGYYAINISRSQGTATPISASGTAFGAAGAVPNAGVIDATAATVSNPYKWYVSLGNKLAFF
ncbi:MAG TPA: hypothetical protein VH560_10480, partial [Polyangia bacterium]|nr:hypothetical protein [Polyangia bacterium]